jgi:hypothetical protein
MTLSRLFSKIACPAFHGNLNPILQSGKDG